MDEFIFNTIKTVFALAAMQGKQLCFSPSDGQFYEVKGRDADGCTLYPLGGVGADGSCSPIFHLNPDELLFGDDLQSQRVETLKNAFLTLKNANETYTERTANAHGTHGERNCNAEATQPDASQTVAQRSVIGRGKVDLPRFAHLYSGDIAGKCAEIEVLLDKILASTNYPKTIQKTVDNYHTANNLATAGKLYELSILADRLRGRINKQAAMSAAMDTMSARRAARRRMTLAIALLVLVGGCFGWQFFNPYAPEAGHRSESTTVATVPESVFDAAVEEWQRTHNRKIYPAGRECLRKACAGINDKSAIMLVIDKNMR